MKRFLKLFTLLWVLFAAANPVSAQPTQLLIIDSVKVLCQGSALNKVPVVYVYLHPGTPWSTTIVYTVTGTPSLTLNSSTPGANMTGNPQTFPAPALINGSTYTITGNVPGVGSNTVSFKSTCSTGPIGPVGPATGIDVAIGKCPSVVNLLPNGNFMYGNDGSFQSALPLKCNSCTAGSYCVGNEFKAKCSGWPAGTYDHTLGTASGSYLLIDGDPNKASNVWSDSVCVCAGKTYTFSFWVKSVFPAPQQQFDLDMLINGASQKLVTVAQTTPAWTYYEVNWTSPFTRCIPIAIKQTTGGAYRDFGLDDIYFGFCCDCQAPEPGPDCCQFGLRLFNNVNGVFKKIKVTPNVPSAISNVFMDTDIDGDNWTLTKGAGGAYYEFAYITGYIPADPSNLIDADFNLVLQPGAVNPKITVEWIDGNNVTQKKESINLVCISDPALFGEDVEYDWLSNTTQLSGAYTQSQIFSGAEIEPCETPEAEDRSETSCGGVTGTIDCAGTSLTLTANSVPNATEYHWNVNGVSVVTTSPSLSVPLALSGQGSVPVTFDAGYIETVTDTSGNSYQVFSILCTDFAAISYCILSAEFTWSKPEADCTNSTLNGWKVTFTPLTPCSNISNFKWDFNDNTPVVQGTGLPANQAHKFPPAGGTFNVTLTLTDSKGCTSTVVKKLTIPNTCSPDWHANYTWCESDSPDPTKKYPITVTFTNQSLCICNSTFTWDFGDPSSGSANTATSTGCTATVSHTYMAKPGDLFTVKLTMKDNPVCPSGVSISHQILLKPVCGDLKVNVCPDGVVKFSTSCSGRLKWKLPNWAALTYNPAFYCLPCPFDPLANASLNMLLAGLGQTSIPQLVLSLFSINNFELKFKDGANFVVEVSNYDDTNSYTTGTCTVRKDVVVHYSCCGNIKAKEYDTKTINGKNYRMTKMWRVKHRDKHGAIWQAGSCFNYFSALIIGERTHLMARTKLEKSKKVKGTSLSYYFPSLAETITARIKGDFRTKGPTGCNCEILAPWNTGLSRSNWFRATYRLTGSQLYKIQQGDLIRSVHVVKKAGVVWDSYISKQPGTCAPVNGY